MLPLAFVESQPAAKELEFVTPPLLLLPLDDFLFGLSQLAPVEKEVLCFRGGESQVG